MTDSWQFFSLSFIFSAICHEHILLNFSINKLSCIQTSTYYSYKSFIFQNHKKRRWKLCFVFRAQLLFYHDIKFSFLSALQCNFHHNHQHVIDNVERYKLAWDECMRIYHKKYLKHSNETCSVISKKLEKYFQEFSI